MCNIVFELRIASIYTYISMILKYILYKYEYTTIETDIDLHIYIFCILYLYLRGMLSQTN